MTWFKSLVKSLYEALFPAIPPPRKMGIVTSQEFYDILHSMFPNARHTYLGDVDYDLTSDKEMGRFFEWSPVPLEKYKYDKRDCERFAIMQMGKFYKWCEGFPFLRIIGFDTQRNIPLHGWNVYVNERKELRFHDPLGLVCGRRESIPAYPLEYIETIS